MADEFEIQDDENKTLAIDGENEEHTRQADAVEEADEPAAEEEGGEDEGASAAALPAPKYKPDSNLYTVLLVLSGLAYAIAIGVALSELRDYCDQQRYMWGMFR